MILLAFKTNKINLKNWNQTNIYLGCVAEGLDVKLHVRATGKFSLERASSESDKVAQGSCSSVLHFQCQNFCCLVILLVCNSKKSLGLSFLYPHFGVVEDRNEVSAG